MLAVERDVPVRDQLAGGGARRREAEAVDDVVQPALQDAQQHLAGVLRASATASAK